MLPHQGQGREGRQPLGQTQKQILSVGISEPNFYFFVCVCGMCMYIHMYVGAHMYKVHLHPFIHVCVCVCRGLRLTSSVFLDCSLPYSVSQDLSLKLSWDRGCCAYLAST